LHLQTLELDPEYILAQFGMGQMHINRGEHDTAIEIFETLHNSQPACIKVTKTLGSLYELARKRDKPVVFF
jgi:RNA polymerase-associated protein CTR9